MSKYFCSLMMIVCLGSCDTVVDEPTDGFKVSGTIVQNGVPLSNAVVTIDEKLNWEDQTESDGSFEIVNVTGGDHTLTVKSVHSSGGFVEKRSEIVVNGDTYFDALKLPKSIVLSEPFDVTSTSMVIRWNPTDAVDFREYKLFRHVTSGLDETTGELIHVSTSIVDTLFVSTDLSPFQAYYFRVYVMNDYGRLGGSNIVKDTTTQMNVIWNGDFESNEYLLNWWSNFDGIGYQLDPVTVKVGNFSLRLHADTTIVPNTMNLIRGAAFMKYFNESEIEFQVGRTYKFSGWMKTSGETQNGYGFPGYLYLGGPQSQAAVYFNQGNDYLQFTLPGNSDWTYFERTFVHSGSTGSGTILIGGICEYVWFDDLRCEIIR